MLNPFLTNTKIGNTQGGHLDFLILSGMAWFASVDPVRNGFSIPKHLYIQISVLSSGSEHLFDISTGLKRLNFDQKGTKSLVPLCQKCGIILTLDNYWVT